MPLIRITNSFRPPTVPWGTPQEIGKNSETIPLIFVLWLLSLRNGPRYFCKDSKKPYFKAIWQDGETTDREVGEISMKIHPF